MKKVSSLLGSIVVSLKQYPMEGCITTTQGLIKYLLKWQKDNVLQVYRELKSIPEVDDTIYSDASIKGWGTHDKHHTINGKWTGGETELLISVLEHTAIKFAIFFLLLLQVRMEHLKSYD